MHFTPGSQIVYVLTNPAMPGLVKIGKTTQSEVSVRMKQLYSTGVPMPFECVFACQVKDATEVEEALHLAFGMTRINPNREFFRLEAERVIAILRLLKVDDVTQEFEQHIESEVPAADKQSAQAFKRSMRPPMNFHELGIPNGSVLTARDSKAECTVIGPKKVEFQGEATSLTAATRLLLGLAEGSTVQPSPYWTFHGQTVKELYEAFHSKAPEEE